MADRALACGRCGEELLGTEDTCPSCGADVGDVGLGILSRLPVSLRQLVIVAGGVLLVVGALLPWTRVERASEIVTTRGIDELAGVLTLVAGILAVVLALAPARFRFYSGWAAVAGLIIGLYNGMVVDLEGLERAVLSSRVQIGLIITVIGGIVAFVPRYRVD